MAGQFTSPPMVIGENSTMMKKGMHVKYVPGEIILDEQGNVLPYPNYKAGPKDKHGQVSLIPRLAAVADLMRETPTAGQYAIEHSKEPQPDLKIPPECYLYDEDRPWVLGKLNPEALSLPEPAEPVPLPQHVLDHLDALEAATMHAMRVRAEENYDDVPDAITKKVAPATEDKVNANKNTVTEQTSEGKIGAAVTISAKKPKSRNASASPVKSASRPQSAGKTSTVTTPRNKSPAFTSRAGLAKSPARGVSPQARTVSSSPARPGTKKTMNAKVDLEIVERKT